MERVIEPFYSQQDKLLWKQQAYSSVGILNRADTRYV